MRPMYINELVALVAEETGISKVMAKKVIYSTLGAVMTRVSWRQSVKIAHFGTFKPVMRSGRIVRNPQTGSPMRIPFRMCPTFTPSSLFKGRVELSNRKLSMTLEDEYMEKLANGSER